MIVLRLSAGESADGFVQPLADDALWSATPLAPDARPARRPADDAPDHLASARWELVFDGEGLDLGRLRRVSAWRAEGGERRVDFEDGDSFAIAAAGDRIVRIAASGRADAEVVERAIGAPLALALAARGRYLLHASAVVADGRAIAFTADSGVGKSTLAAAALAPQLGLRRVADDLLPVRLDAAPAALPHFPQLKLAPRERYPAAAPAAWPLAALIELVRDESGDSPPRLERLAPAESALALARATVAARLFDPPRLAAHLAACGAAAATLVVARWRYPSGVERLPAQLERLLAELG